MPVLISEGGCFVKKKTLLLHRLPECIISLKGQGPVMIHPGDFSNLT
jgi:hypothetical protein